MFVIDRIEGDIVVCINEDNVPRSFPREHFPSDCKEGDVIDIINGEAIVNKNETEKRQKNIKILFDKLFK